MVRGARGYGNIRRNMGASRSWIRAKRRSSSAEPGVGIPAPGAGVEERSTIPVPSTVIIPAAPDAPPGRLEPLARTPGAARYYVRLASAFVRVMVKVCCHILGEHPPLLREVPSIARLNPGWRISC